jgi:hypothetical protein
MDPDQALKNARAALASVRNDEDDQSDFAMDLADAFDALDGWLSKGGYLPQPWSEAGKVGTDVR